MHALTAQFFIIIATWSIWFFVWGTEGLISIKENVSIVFTMLIGSFVAGSTSLGGGAIAFPVFTKILYIDNHTALLFSLAIQSVGMGAASVLIFLTKTPVNYRIVRFSIIGGSAGIILSYFFIRTNIPNSEIKVIFSCFSLFVAVGLFFAYFQKSNVPVQAREVNTLTLLAGSFIGGLISGIIGSGIDFILFSLMFFLWKIDFKKAIASSVMIMAVNSLIGFVSITLFTTHFSGQALDYWAAAIPIVVIGAPLGAIFCRKANENYIILFLFVLIALDLTSTISIVDSNLYFLLFILVTVFSYIIFKHNSKNSFP